MVRTSNGYKPAIGYLRRSTDRQEQSIGDQRRVIEAYALNHGYDILNFYTDDAISGATSSERAAFLKLIDDAKKKDCPFKHILVYDIKRFGRLDNDEAGFYRHQLKTRGIEINYVSEGFNGDDTDDLLRPVKQWQARQELKDLSKVTIRGLLTRADGGWWVGGIPPYGYDLCYFSGTNEFICVVRYMSDGSRQVLDDTGNIVRTVPKGDAVQFTKRDRSKLVLSSSDRVRVIQDIFRWYSTGEYGYKGIANQLNKHNVATATGGVRRSNRLATWCGRTIDSILRNPIYTGDMVWNRTSFGKFHRISNGVALQTRYFPGQGCYKNNPEDWIVHSNNHPAIISRTEFEQAQKRRGNTEKFGLANTCNVGRGANSPFLLTGLIFCARCNHHWNGYTVQKGRKKNDGSSTKTLYYACGAYINKGVTACPRKVIRKDWLEGKVVSAIRDMLQKYFVTSEGLKQLELQIAATVEGLLPEIGEETDKLLARKNEISRIIDNLIENLTVANREFVDRKLGDLKQELNSIDGRLMELEARQSKQLETKNLIANSVVLAQQFLDCYESGTVEEKRMFIRAFVSRVEIHPIEGKGRIELTNLGFPSTQVNLHLNT